MSEELLLDDLDRKVAAAFAGRVVRKDLVKRLKVGFSIPVYVLEYLLGKYCSTTDPPGDRGRTEARQERHR